jgi:hypothetical protein
MNDQRIKDIFETTVKECKRSFTKQDLHSNPHKEDLLARKLDEAREKYGATIADQVQKIYEKQNPALSFLFAQVTNAIIEKTFHGGSCHAQAAYSLIECCKKGIYNVSLVFSRTNDPTTEHMYLLLFDEFTFNALAKQPSSHPTYFLFNPKDFQKMWTFFDSWSNQLCEWKNFRPQNNYTKAIKNSPQTVIKPLIHLFQNEIGLLEKIIWCLTEYTTRLNNLPLDKQVTLPISLGLIKSLTVEDNEFNEEINLLLNPQKCVAKLLLSVEGYKEEFTKILASYKQFREKNEKKEKVLTEEEVKEKEDKLLSLTQTFFGQNPNPNPNPNSNSIISQWRSFPEEKLVGTKYAGHQVRFFTMKGETSQKADEFVSHLKAKGANLEKTKTKSGDPSITVDLTVSEFKL